MIEDQRKKVLSDLASFIADEFSINSVTQLELIADSEGISFYYDHYEDCFDGILIYDENKFHIHLNLDRGNSIETKRGRFSFAHELAHYFIEEHRIPLSKGEVAPHGSLHDFGHNDSIEEEADYFAACLLMPEQLFRKIPTGKTFSLNTITTLSKAFDTSILATILRFTEIGTHGILAVISENNIVKWFSKSKDFPNWTFLFKRGKPLPPTSVAGEFNLKGNGKYTGIEDVEPNDWFNPAWIPNTQMHEQCYYSDSYGYIISLIWFN